MNKKRVYLRADGNSSIGFGHMSRTLSLASMLKDEFNCIFVSCSDAFEKEASEYCNERVTLNEENHFTDFLAMLSADDIIVLDNYFFDGEYQKKIKDIGCKLVCIDDIHTTHFYADVVINHAEGINPEHYSCEPYSMLYTGYKYALLRPEFTQAAQLVMPESDKEGVVICIGGGDPLHLTPKFVEILRKIGYKGTITAITNESIADCSTRYGLSASEMVQVFQNHYFGILPASTVAIEACACRLPFACGFFVVNQTNIYAALEKMNMCLPLKDISIAENIEEKLKIMLNKIQDSSVLADISNNQSLIIDGKSPQRLIRIFKEL